MLGWIVALWLYLNEGKEKQCFCLYFLKRKIWFLQIVGFNHQKRFYPLYSDPIVFQETEENSAPFALFISCHRKQFTTLGIVMAKLEVYREPSWARFPRATSRYIAERTVLYHHSIMFERQKRNISFKWFVIWWKI